MREALRRAIAATTERHTGSLEGDWQFILSRRSDQGKIIEERALGAVGDITLGPHDRVLLVPTGAAAQYAAFVNMRVKHGGQLSRKVRSRKTKEVRRVTEGFMASAARAVRRNPAMATISVRVIFTHRFAPSGASSKQGMPVLSFAPKRFRRQ